MDKYIDSLSDNIAEQSKRKGLQHVYDLNEKLAYEKYSKVSRAAGRIPFSYEELKKRRSRESGALSLFDENPLGDV